MHPLPHAKSPLRRAALLLAFSLLSISLSAQSEFRLLFQVSQPAKRMAADKLRQLYLVTPSNEVIKYSPEGKELYRFNNNTFGDLGHIDATDPFNLLLYYPDFQVVLILDRTLNLLGEYNLWEYGLYQPGPLGMANDNLLWVYDEPAFRLKKLDRQGRITAQSHDLNQLLPRAPSPVALIARNNLVYLHDPETGILVFDNFGQYIRTLPLAGASRFQIDDDDTLWVRRDGAWTHYDARAMQALPVPLPDDDAKREQVWFFRDRAYVLEESGVAVWGR